MSIVKEFKEFAVKGNAMDLAVGVIIGAAFGKIIDSIVKDLIMPIVSAIIGKPDFSNLYVVLRGDVPVGAPLVDAQKVSGAAIFAYGNFITVAINFLLLAIIVFIMVRAINTLKREKEQEVVPAVEVLTKEEMLLTEIRDALKAKP